MLVVVPWILSSGERRRGLLPFLAGIFAVSALAAGALAASGSLRAFLDQMAWLSRNYTTVNVMPYGSVIGGYGRILSNLTGAEYAVTGVVLVCMALPAILPPVAILVWLLIFRGKREPAGQRSLIIFLLCSMVALILTTFPRADLMHLAFVAALPYALAGSAAAVLSHGRLVRSLIAALAGIAVLFVVSAVLSWYVSAPIDSPIGRIRVPVSQKPGLESLLADVHPGQTLFVYPYMPIHYFLTQARNPTRFSFLAPGMMTTREEVAALEELRRDPPEWVLFLPLTREEFLRIFPNASSLSERFVTLESWVKNNYQPVRNPPVAVMGYELWKRAERN